MLDAFQIGGIMPELDTIRPCSPCVLFTPGHAINWIHWRASTKSRDQYVDVEVVSIGDDTFTVQVDRGLLAYRNHDIGRLRDIVEKHGPWARYVGFGSLSFGGMYVNVKEDDGYPLDACRTIEDVRAERQIDGGWFEPVTFASSSIDVSIGRTRRPD